MTEHMTLKDLKLKVDEAIAEHGDTLRVFTWDECESMYFTVHQIEVKELFMSDLDPDEYEDHDGSETAFCLDYT